MRRIGVVRSARRITRGAGYKGRAGAGAASLAPALRPPQPPRAVSVAIMTKCFLLLAALVSLQVSAEEPERCTYGAAGDLVGREIFVNRSALQPLGRRYYNYDVPSLPGCALNGVSARVCDLFPPAVAVEGGLARVRVRRLGPRLRPLRLDLWLYCDELN